MQRWYVWLICCVAVAVEEMLSAVALRRGYLAAEALHSTRYTIYVVAGVGAGRLAAATSLASALRAGGLAGIVTGLIAATVYQVTLTAGTLGLLGAAVGWGVRRSVEPAA